MQGVKELGTMSWSSNLEPQIWHLVIKTTISFLGPSFLV